MDARKIKEKAQEAFGKGKFARAAEAYAQYCEADPGDLHARLRMGDAWAKAGQKEKAIGAYSWAAEGFAKDGFLPRAIAASKLILELDPAHKGVQKMLADLYARKNQPAKRPATLPPMPVDKARGISLEADSAPSKPGSKAPPKNEPPSPMNRADAIELPPDDLPAEKPTAFEAKQQSSFANRKDAIELPEPSPPGMARAPGSRSVAIELGSAGEDPGGIELDVSTTGGTGEIEIASIDSMPSAPPPPPRAKAAPVPLDGPLEGPLDGPLDAPPIKGEPLDEPLLAAKPPAPAPGPKGGVYDLDTGGDDDTLDSFTFKLKTEQPKPPPAPEPPPDPQPSAPAIALEVEVEGEPEPEPILLEKKKAPAPPPPAAFAPEELSTPAPQVDLPSPSLAIPSVAPIAPPAGAPRPSPSLPPGLKPRKPVEAPREEPAPAAAAPASDARIWLPPGFAPPAVASVAAAVEPARAAPSGASETKAPATDLEKSLEAFAKFDVDEVMASPTRAPDPKPASPARAVMPDIAGFTELELEGDSLLHAVEAAAQHGKMARGEGGVVEEVVDAAEADAAAPGALPKIPLFSDLPEDAFIALFERCPLKRHEPGEAIVQQGTQGDAFYVICAGSVRVFRTDQGRRRDLATLDEGAFFGEMALLSDAPRSASVEAASPDTQLLEISAAVLAELSKQYPQVAAALKKFCRQRMLSNLMNSAPLFQPFSKNDRRDLVQKFRAREAKKGELVIREGQRSDGMYVILSGEVDVSVGPTRVASLREGEVFGEMSLLTKAPATATVVTARRTSLLRLPREDFDALILSHPQILMLVSELTDERKRQNAKLAPPMTPMV